MPQAGPWPAQLLAGVGGGWRALWTLQLHRPVPARTLVRASGFGAAACTEVVTDGVVVRETAHGNPLEFIAAYQQRFKVALRPGMPRFCGGLAGYFGYDAVRYIEKKLESTCPPDEIGCPDILLLQCEELAVIDNLSGKLHLIVIVRRPAQPEAAISGANDGCVNSNPRLAQAVCVPRPSPSPPHPPARTSPRTTTWPPCVPKELIAGGDFMQVRGGPAHQKATAPRR